MLKRYLVFSGSVYYPVGGWNDFKCAYSSIKAAEKRVKQDEEDWSHIIDLETGKEIDK